MVRRPNGAPDDHPPMWAHTHLLSYTLATPFPLLRSPTWFAKASYRTTSDR